ncbi:MAG: glycine cleavage system protein H [Acidobacteria bacterium]|nr:glycine cleavage system protein H [Acidobacteriota bacterium]
METAGIDIFATKGMEYLFVIGFLLLLIFFWRLLYPPKEPVFNRADPNRSNVPIASRFRLAEGFFYHQGHSWAVPEEQNVVRVGIDDFTQQLLGQLRAINLPKIGVHVKQGRKEWKLWVDSKAIDILSPVGGHIVAINNEAIRNPSLINNDPYGSGWLVKVKVANVSNDLVNLLSGDRALAWMRESAEILYRGMKHHTFGDICRSVSVPVAGIVQNLYPENWDKVAAKLLSGE